MKKLFTIAFLSFLVCAFVSCKDEGPDDVQTPKLEIDKSQLIQNFETPAGSKSLTVISNREFTAKSSDESWCAAKVVADKKSENLIISVTQNTEPTKREAKITVAVKELDPITITVVQIGTDPVIIVTESQAGINIQGDNVEFLLEVTTNIAVNFELPAWITKKESKVNTTHVYTFVAGAMPVGVETRTDNIQVKAGESSIVIDPVLVSVTQTQVYPVFFVMSDNHYDRVSAGTDAITRSKKVLTTLFTKVEKVDAIFIIGDYADRGSDAQYMSMLSVFKDPQYVPSDVPVYPMMGNHDYYTGSITESQNRFKTNFGVNSIHKYGEVKGYPFITISVDQSTAPWYNQGTKDFVKASLADAAAKYPGKPIFMFSHIPVSGTIIASNSWGSNELTSILDQYPQIIFYSGHTHHSISNPRSIHQDKFTTVNDGSAWYASVDDGIGMVGGDEPVGHDLFLESLITRVKPNWDVDIQRLDLFRDEEILPRWVVKAPHNGSAFQYKGLTGGSAPVFASGVKPVVSGINPTSCKVEWKQATDDDKVYYYIVEAVNAKDNKVAKTLKIFSYFIWNSDMPESRDCDMGGLVLGTEYYIRLTAVDAYDNKSTSVRSDNFTTKEYQPDPSTRVPVADLFDVVFGPEGALDFSPMAHQLEVGENAPITAFNVRPNSYVAVCNANQSTHYKLWYKDKQAMKDALVQGFTLEAYYMSKPSEPGDQCPVSAQQQGGFGIEIANKIPQFWAYINGGYYSLYPVTAMNTTDFYHMAFTYDKKEGRIKAYINGSPEGEVEVTGDLTFPVNPAAQWFGIGADCNVVPYVDYPFDGQIVCTRLYSRAITRDEAYLLNKQFADRKNFANLGWVDGLIRQIITKIATATGADKDNLITLKNEGVALVGNFATAQTQILQYITKAQNALK